MDETNKVLPEGDEPTTQAADNEPVAAENAVTEGESTEAQGEQTEGVSTEPSETRDEGNHTDTGGAAAPFMTVRYNHEERDLTADEAKQYAQIGIKYENTKAIYDKLDYAAALKGVTVDELVNELMTVPENEERQKLKDMYGDDEESVEIGMRIFREKRQADYQKVVDTRAAEAQKASEQTKENTRSRLADEYIALKAEIPEVPEYEKLPDSVIRDAASGKRDLLSAYLLWQRREEKQIAAAKETQQVASAASAGQMNTSEDSDSSLSDIFSDGVWGR